MRYETKVLKDNGNADYLITGINMDAEAGWELVNVVVKDNIFYAFLRREVAPPKKVPKVSVVHLRGQ